MERIWITVESIKERLVDESLILEDDIRIALRNIGQVG